MSPSNRRLLTVLAGGRVITVLTAPKMAGLSALTSRVSELSVNWDIMRKRIGGLTKYGAPNMAYKYWMEPKERLRANMELFKTSEA